MQRIHNINNSINASSFLTSLFSIYIIFCFFEPYINALIGSIGKYFIFIVIIFFIMSYKIVKIEWFHMSIILWLTLKILSIFWASYNQIVQQHFISQIGMVILFITMTMVTFDSKFTNSIINSLLYSSFLLGFLCLFFSEPFGGVITRQVLTILGAQMDPNNQSAFLIIGITISSYILINKKSKVSYCVFLIGVIIVNIYAMFLTGSRGGLVSLVLILLTLSLLSEKGDKLISKQTIRNFIIILLIVLVTYFLAKAFLPEKIFDRLFVISGYQGGSDRVNIWGNAIKIFIDNPLIGGGWGSYWGYNGYYIVIHNTFLSVLIDGGLVGIILFFLPSLFIFVRSIKQQYVLPILILISGLAPSFFIDAINKRFFWNAIIVSMILVTSKSKIQSEVVGEYYDNL